MLHPTALFAAWFCPAQERSDTTMPRYKNGFSLTPRGQPGKRSSSFSSDSEPNASDSDTAETESDAERSVATASKKTVQRRASSLRANWRAQEDSCRWSVFSKGVGGEGKSGTGDCCCKRYECTNRYTLTIVHKVRLLLNTLQPARKDQWLKQFFEQAALEAEEKRGYYFLPPPEELESTLHAVTPETSITVMDAALFRAPDEKKRVCYNFMRLLLGNPSKRNRTGSKASDERGVVKGRHGDRARKAGKKTLAKGALDMLKDDGLKSPTQDVYILPFARKLEVHAACVLLMMGIIGLKCPDWSLTIDFIDADTSSSEDENCSDDRASGKQRERFRYRNPMLGLMKPGETLQPDIPCYEYFLFVWRKEKELRKIKVRRWLPFAKCDICKELRTLTAKPGISFEDKEKAREKHRLHVAEVAVDRNLYYEKRDRSLRNPVEELVVTMDGAGCQEHELPHFWDQCKATAVHKCKVHVYGALVHGHSPRVFLSEDVCKQGNNVSIQALWNILVDRFQADNMPKKLWLLLDNTTKQNKGQYFLFFLELLVARGVIDQVELNFFRVGHTHEDIDQFFSRIAMRLRAVNAPTLKRLAKHIQKCYKSKTTNLSPVVTQWKTIANISGLFDELVAENKVQRFPAGITDYRFFRFSRDEQTGRSMIQVRSNVVASSMRGAPLDELRSPEQAQNQSMPVGKSWSFFPGGVVPDLADLACRKKFPSAQMRDRPDNFEKYQKSKRKMIENLYNKGLLKENHKAALEGMCDREESPGARETTFDWDTDLMAAILTPEAAPNPGASSSSSQQDMGAQWWPPRKGTFWMIWAEAHPSFWIGKVLEHGACVGAGSPSDVDVKIQWYQAEGRKGKNLPLRASVDSFVTGVYKVQPGATDTLKARENADPKETVFQAQVFRTKRGNLTVASQKIVRAWLEARKEREPAVHGPPRKKKCMEE
jgi:hypothetical protein